MARKEIEHLDLFERKLIEGYLCSGMSVMNISINLNRSENCIREEINRSGGKTKYNAVQADLESKERQKNKKNNPQKTLSEEKIYLIHHAQSSGLSQRQISKQFNISRHMVRKYSLRGPAKDNEPQSPTLEERIVSLEFQIEIMLEQIRRLNDKVN